VTHPDVEKVLTFGFNSAQDVFEKLKRDAIKLEKDYRSKDECFNFLLTAWHLYYDWMKNDIKLSQLAKNKHELAKPAMGSMAHALEVVANSNKHIRVRNNRNVTETKYGEVVDWYSFFKGDFPTIITDKAEYPLWRMKDILIEYFEWIFDGNETDLALKPNLLSELNKFYTHNS
jgi:hypothetical protein